VKADLPEDIPEKISVCIENLEANLERDFVDLIEGNEIFVARTRGVGKMTQEKALEMGLTGPPLRCTGVDFDIRRDYPHSWYPNVEFDVITDTEGDVEAAYRVRIGEIKQSIRIIKQVLEKLPEGEVMGDVSRRVRPPEGEGFGRVESPRGEYAVHVVSDGSDVPYRVHYRDPSFVNMQLFQEIMPGHYLPDIIAIMGLVDPVSGGWDK
jgi:NADH-quinone oxidoreductase subunit D